MAVSAVIFSLMHIGNPNVSAIGLTNIVLVGILFSYMFIKSGSIWMPIGYHITWNYFQGDVFGFQVSGLKQVGIYKTTILNDNIINGGAFGPEGGIATTVVIIMGLLFVEWYYKNSEFEFLPKNINKTDESI
jgi:membrane protease YdiL (CAAX protease family)